MPLTAQDTERVWSTRPARSGCMSSMPVSMTPTVTGACATGTAPASRALIAAAPQFEMSSAPSASVASWSRTLFVPPAGAPDCGPLCAPPCPDCGEVGSGAGLSPGVFAAARSPSGTGATRVGPTECTLIPALAMASARSGANEADSLWAKKVPICG